MSNPSVEAAAHERPSGEKRTHAHRMASLVTRSDRRASERGAPADASSSSESSRMSCTGPAAVKCAELSCIRTPSNAALLLSTYLRNSVRSASPYRHTNLELPPARSAEPSAEKASERKHLLPEAFLDDTLDRTDLPPEMSARPSMEPTCAAVAASHSATPPSRVETARVAPSGEKARARTSEPWASDSMELEEETKSHSLTVASHEPEASVHAPPPPPAPKARQQTGPVWPASVSSSWAVCKFHTYTSYVSREPAHTISPDGSTATHPSCAGDGVTSVWKLRKRSMSKARTVPSSEAETSARPCGTKARSTTAAVCSEKVTKQKPEAGDHSFTLASPPPVAMTAPPGE
eukprot:scaffold15425_cov110-Isochrysis_galbana.AAC.6